MSTAASAGRPGNPVTRTLAWLSHFEPWIIVALAPYVLLSRLLPDSSWWLSAVAILLMMSAVTGSVFHELLYPCNRCVERFPVDAPAEAARKRATLVRFHNFRRTRVLMWAMLAWFIVAPIVALIVGPPLLSAFTAVSPWATTALFLLLAYLAYERHAHRKLRPWCPICRRRDEDDDPINVPAPTPPAARVDA